MTPFILRFSATPRGARLARRLVSRQMDVWGWPYGTSAHDAVELVAGELAANAVTHGRVPGRDAELRLSRCDGDRVRVEVADTLGERLPRREPAGPDAEHGRGLILVATLSETWGVAPRPGGPGKTVWAVIVTPRLAPARPPAPAAPTSHIGSRTATGSRRDSTDGVSNSGSTSRHAGEIPTVSSGERRQPPQRADRDSATGIPHAPQGAHSKFRTPGGRLFRTSENGEFEEY
ncbi:ATP-binding protein [Streptomyces sp. NPDC001443]